MHNTLGCLESTAYLYSVLKTDSLSYSQVCLATSSQRHKKYTTHHLLTRSTAETVGITGETREAMFVSDILEGLTSNGGEIVERVACTPTATAVVHEQGFDQD